MPISDRAGGRRFWLAVHRYSGLAMLVFLGIAALTGCILSFKHPLDALLNPSLFRPAAAGLIDPLVAVDRLERERPGLAATYFPARAVAGRNIAVAVAPRGGGPALGYDEVFLDAGDGHVAGVRTTAAGWDAPHLLQGVYLFHFTLLAGDVGRWLIGVVAAVWLLSNLIGVYLTWPLRPPWRQWRRSWTWRWSSPLPRLLLDIHRASALWLLPALTVLAFTSLAMNFFDEALVPAVRRLSPPFPSPFDRPAAKTPSTRTIGFADALRDATVLAARQGGDRRAAVVQYEPDRDLVGVRFTASGIENYQGLGPVTYWFDGRDGRFVYEDDPYRDSTGQKLIRALYPLHTGAMIGGWGVAFDVVLGLAVVEMSGTGGYLWLKRPHGKTAGRRAAHARHDPATTARRGRD